MLWLKNFKFPSRYANILRNYSTKTKPNLRPHALRTLNAEDKPIKYSLSPASRWRAEQTRSGIIHERLWYEPYVLMASLAVMLVYFCILREENDIDLEISKSLYERIEGLEEHQLRVLLDYNKRHGLDNEPVLKRLKELESSRNVE